MNEKVKTGQRELEAYKAQIEALEKELSRYKLAASGANDGLWDWDLENELPFVSDPWLIMLGMNPEDSPTQEGLWESLLHPDDKQEAIKKFQDFINGESPQYNEVFRLRHTDGSYRWIRSKAKSIKNDRGEVIRISGSHTDITGKKEADDALIESREKYRLLFQNSLVGMFRTDLGTGEIIESNDKVWELLGTKRPDKSTTFDFYKNPADRQRLIAALAEKGVVENFEVELIKPSGEAIWVSVNSRVFIHEKVIESVVIDITEQKQLILELQKVNFELDNFVYHASHDLRSPLSSILGLLNIYKQEKNPSVQADCIHRIENSVIRLDSLVRDLLAISRNDRVDDPHVPLNFMIEINNSISSYFSGLNVTNLDMHVRIRQPYSFSSDMTRIRIVLDNLISNAIKYRDLEKPMSLVEVDVIVTPEQAAISVKDNGLGIDRNKINNIFNMFYRAHEASEGSGLGLYIVKNVVEKLNGKIEVTSTPKEGTTFHVTIPNSTK